MRAAQFPWVLLAPLLAVWTISCADLQPISKGQCDNQHPCPQGNACIDHLCFPTGRLPCSKDTECLAGHCSLDKGYCVTCTLDEHCAFGVCHPEVNVCVGCLEDQDCLEGVCLPQSHTCVGCKFHSDCDSGLCSLRNHICLGCKFHEQCPSGICELATGICEESSTESPLDAQGGVE